MAPRKHPSRRTRPAALPVPTAPSSDDPHDIVYFRRHKSDDPSQATPGREFVDSCPTGVRAKFRAVLVAVATAPPKRFAGGGYWEAMKGDMAGWFEVRVDGPKRHHYRLFCLLDYEAKARDNRCWLLLLAWTSRSGLSSRPPIMRTSGRSARNTAGETRDRSCDQPASA